MSVATTLQRGPVLPLTADSGSTAAWWESAKRALALLGPLLHLSLGQPSGVTQDDLSLAIPDHIQALSRCLLVPTDEHQRKQSQMKCPFLGRS
jgi:hypothetical protein